jgi:hypothetical protein
VLARARRHQQQRRLATRAAAAAAGTAAGGAIAVFAVAAPGGAAHHLRPGAAGSSRPAGTSPTPPAGPRSGYPLSAVSRPPSSPGARVRTVAEVVGRTERAIGTGDLIMESTSPARIWMLGSPSDRHKPIRLNMIAWSYRNRQLGELFGRSVTLQTPPMPRIRLATRLGSQRPGATTQATVTTVDYARRTWSTTRERVMNPPAPTTMSCSLRRYLSRPLAPYKTDLAATPSAIRAALACGGLRIAGRGQVDGAPVITMKGTPRLTSYPLTLDVSPATYLPVRMDFGGLRWDYRWLPPTAASLARLNLHVPQGFRQVPPAG